jgi:DNA-directed DNA polymerase III PolC
VKHRKNYPLPASLSLSFSASPSPTSLSTSKTPAWLAQARPRFVELLARSNFSFLQGASHPEEMVLRAKKLGYDGVALCDVNGLYGVVRGYQAIEKPSAFDAEQLASTPLDGKPATTFRYMCGAELTPYDSSPMILLPMNKYGYVRLCHLLTKCKRHSPKGHITLALQDVLDESEDLLVFPLPPWNDDHLKKMQHVFKDRIYLPVHRDFTWESTQQYQSALRLERELGLALFATQKPLFHEPQRKPLHDVVTCILHKTTLEEVATKLSLNRERYLKTPEQLAFLFRERPDFLSRTVEIMNRVEFSLSELRYKYPQEVLPPGKTTAGYLRELVEAGLAWRYHGFHNYEKSERLDGRNEKFCRKARQKIESEMALIHELEYEDYFLTLWDICNFAKSKRILYQGRGSAANSIVCFALGLTNVEPIERGLLFERFISRERGEPPDIDIDFEHARREEVIQYIYTKYGERHAAMVCTVICYRSRMSTREVAKAMGMPLDKINRLIKFMGREGISRLLEGPVDLTPFDLSEDRFRLLIQLAMELRGFPRHLGIHSGGFVISHEPIVDIVPVESATMNKRYVIQWNKDDINTLGLMKIDILALGMLHAVQKSLELLRSHKGIDWNMAQFPQNDTATYDMICKADTIGVFQIESRAQMSLLPRLKPRCYYDLVIEVAIVRPGPIQGGMVHPYLKRRAGKEKITYAHPSLVPILGKTLGIPLFQEQVMQIAVAVAGFTPGESDELRRIMSSAWKKKPLMDGIRQRVINGMLAHGLKQEYAEQIYKTIEGFSSYGFPESHAASFALITYVSCYLKCHHPDVFTTALLNSQPMGFYSPRQLIADAQRHGVQFLPLDVQESVWDYELAERTTYHNIRTGFRSVYGLREEHAQTIVTERQQHGRYLDLSDLIRRTKLTKNVLIRLAAAGALEIFALNTREALWVIQGLSFDTQSFFFGAPLDADPEHQLQTAATLPEESVWQEIHREYETKGFSIDNHPIGVLRPLLKRISSSFVSAVEMEELKDRSKIRVAGLMSLIQSPPTAKGMCFLSVEDETGLINAVLTPDIYKKYRTLLVTHPLLDIEGVLESRDGVRNIRALILRPLLEENFEADLKQLSSTLIDINAH